MCEKVITISDVTIILKKQFIFNELSFTCGEGEIIGIIGPNGSGKSVFFKLLAGFLRPEKGSVIVNGVDLYKTRSFPPLSGFLIEEPPFLSRLTGFANLELLGSIQNKVDKTSIEIALKRVGLFEERHTKVGEYSLGMKKKLGIAQTFMENQRLIVLDEPMNALDEGSVIKVRQLLKELVNEGKTIMIASHNQADIDYLCDKIYRVENKKLQLFTKKEQTI